MEISLENIKSNCNVDKTTGCWEWKKYRTKEGYGVIRGVSDGTFVTDKAHRAAWIAENGKIPNGLFICHHCDNPPCCNPDHLFLGTHKDNVADCIRKGRTFIGKKRGEQVHCAKLTREQVVDIRRRGIRVPPGGLHGRGGNIKELANEFQVTTAAILQILRRETWKHVM
jgi:hypothetical protein